MVDGAGSEGDCEGGTEEGDEAGGPLGNALGALVAGCGDGGALPSCGPGEGTAGAPDAVGATGPLAVSGADAIDSWANEGADPVPSRVGGCSWGAAPVGAETFGYPGGSA
ncbi:hypothetical protein ADL25_06490 [Streptomyces sp. NRRL F-5122]|nr:hypothetical protein ADL25_06490 [Streptomyces sp. NRRL F-5122]